MGAGLPAEQFLASQPQLLVAPGAGSGESGAPGAPRRFLLGRGVSVVLSPRFWRVWKGSCSCDRREKWHGVKLPGLPHLSSTRSPFGVKESGQGSAEHLGLCPVENRVCKGRVGGLNKNWGAGKSPGVPAALRRGRVLETALVQEVLGEKEPQGAAESRIWDAGGGENQAAVGGG